jgi:hypothetical protein
MHNLKAKQNRKLGVLTAREISCAELTWIRDMQNSAYSVEIAALKAKQKSVGKLARQLRLFIDNDGLLRVGGRLHNAPLRYEAKFPLLLPQRNRFTELVIIAAH